MEKILSEDVYYYFESPDGLHRSDLMPEDCMKFYREKGEFGVLEPVGDTGVKSPKKYEIGKVHKCTYRATLTEEVL